MSKLKGARAEGLKSRGLPTPVLGHVGFEETEINIIAYARLKCSLANILAFLWNKSNIYSTLFFKS